jgi:hypothetical protein
LPWRGESGGWIVCQGMGDKLTGRAHVKERMLDMTTATFYLRSGHSHLASPIFTFFTLPRVGPSQTATLRNCDGLKRIYEGPQ